MSKSWLDVGIDLPGGARGEVDVICPQCSPSRKKSQAKCLSVNVEKGIWNCAHCAWHGGLTEGEQGKSNPYTWIKKIHAKPAYPVNLPMTVAVEDWFLKRGITAKTLERYHISGGVVYMPQTEKHEDVIQFPYYRGGELINVKYRSQKAKDFRMVGGAERILYGLDDIDPSLPVIFVEGEGDKLSFAEISEYNVLSVPDGAPSPDSKNLNTKLSYLDSAVDLLNQIPAFILMTDNDAPGIFLREELTRRLGADRCSIVSYPDGCKDANDILLKYGADALRQVLLQARPVPVAGIVGINEYTASIQAIYDEGMPPGVSTGWPSVDTLYTVKPGRLTVVTAVPGSGKSNVLDNLLLNLAKLHQWRFGVYSPENFPTEGHILRLIEKFTLKSGRLNAVDRLTQSELETGRDWLNEYFWFFGIDENIQMTVDNLLEQAKSLVRRFGVRGIVVDPWNEVEHACPAGMTETQYISQSLSKFRKFARTHGVHVWIVVHPTKLYRDKAGEYPKVTLYDCAGGAHWRNKADFGIAIHRSQDDPYDRKIEFDVQKCRFRAEGMMGQKVLLFNPAYEGYEEDINQEGGPAF